MCAICSTGINVDGYFGGSLIKNKFHLVFYFFEARKSEKKNASQRIVKRNVF